MSNSNSNTNKNSDETIPESSKKPLSPKKGLKTGHKINLAGVLIAFLLLIVTTIGIFKPEIFGLNKTDPCATLKKREDLIIEKIGNLVKRREDSADKDSIEKYFDFEINFANAELDNIKDSLKLCEN